MSVNNEWRGIGNLGSDPELRRSASGAPVVTLSIATDRRHRRKNPTTGQTEVVEATDWIPVVCWGPLAESCAKWLKQGSLVAVSGSLRPREWTDEEGNKHRTAEIRADEVKFLDRIRTPDEVRTSVENSAGA